MRGTTDGFKADTFHSLCDNQGPTLTVIKSHTDFIFGGFTKMNWEKKDDGDFYVQDLSAFLFSFNHNTVHPVVDKPGRVSFLFAMLLLISLVGNMLRLISTVPVWGRLQRDMHSGPMRYQ